LKRPIANISCNISLYQRHKSRPPLLCIINFNRVYHHRDSPSHQHLAPRPLVDVSVLLFAVPFGILEQIATRETCIFLLKVGMTTTTITKINYVQPFNTMMMMTMTMMSRRIFSLLNKASF
jgi:hypothetical protein